MEPMSTKKYSNTDVEEVKRLNANSGLSYNEVKQQLAKEFFKKNTN